MARRKSFRRARSSIRSYMARRRAQPRMALATGMNIANIATTIGFGTAPGVGYNVVGDIIAEAKKGANANVGLIGHGIRHNLTIGLPRIAGGIALQVIGRKLVGRVPIGKVGKWQIDTF